MTINWDPEFTVWDRELDEHHQQLIRYIQLLDDPHSRQREEAFLHTVLDGLVTYAALHFEAEERRMREVEYPRLDVHRQEHVNFSKDVAIFRDSFGQASEAFQLILVNYLKDWLTKHILSSDKRFGEWLHLRAPGPRPS